MCIDEHKILFIVHALEISEKFAFIHNYFVVHVTTIYKSFMKLCHIMS